MTRRNQYNVLIVGAGIAGLTTGILLARAGNRVTIAERDTVMRGGGFLISLSHQAYACAARLGILPRLQERTYHITQSSYHDITGRALLTLDYQKLFAGLDVIQPMRNEVALALLEEAEQTLEIRRGESITTLQQDSDVVKVDFTSGESGEYDIVIGADGVHSIVRQLAFEEQAITRHHLDLCCAAYRLPNVLGLDRKFETHMERQRYMATFSTAADEIGGVFVWESRSREIPSTGEERRSKLLSAFVDSAAAAQAALDYCPAEQTFYMDYLQQISLTEWHRGRVILVGDAAHCMTLFSGRGAAAAMVGASLLADALTESPDPETAFEAYTRQYKPNIDRMQTETRKAVRWYVPRNMTTELIRNNAMRFLPNHFFQRYFHAKYASV